MTAQKHETGFQYGKEDSVFVARQTLANVEALFFELAALYGSRFADMWGSMDADKVKQVWASALSGYRIGEVRKGLEGCRSKSWPPTLPEFLLLCRPPPDFESLFSQAQLQVWRRMKGEDVWPDRVLFWAAFDFGFYEMKMASWQSAKNRWCRIYQEKRDAEEMLPIIPPPAPALVDEGPVASSVCAAKACVANLRRILAGSAVPGRNERVNDDQV